MNAPHELYVCWTTTSNANQAQALARLAIEKELAACAQIDGPITSFYRWEGAIQEESEVRVWFKCLAPCLDALEATVKEAHPYATPQWVCVKAQKVGENYLKWAGEVSNFLRFQ